MAETSQPRAFGDYVVDRELGRGGMGVVYAATHAALGKRVAVKVLLADVSRDAELLERFQNEARAASAIEHPSIVEIHTVGHEGDAVYIVMELLQGESLATRLRTRGAMSIGDALGVARQCANALDAAHRVGIVHRDLKPDNVFLVPDIEVAGGERVKLLDFGIAKLVGAETSSSVARTVTGAILGTPHYMSPEQCEGAREVDARSDLYSLGCMVFQMVTGRLPFISAGVGGLIGMHLHVAPPTLRSIRPEVPPALDELVNRLLAKTPEARPQSAAEVSSALQAISPPTSRAALPPPPIVDATTATISTVVASREELAPRRSSRRVLAIAGGGAVVAAVIGYAVTRGDDAPTVPPSRAPVPPAIVAKPAQPREVVDAELQVARELLASDKLDGAELLATHMLTRSPKDPQAVAFAADLGKARASHVLDGMRRSAAARNYDAVWSGVGQVHAVTQDRELGAEADEIWRRVKPAALAAVKAQVMAAATRSDCKAAATAAKLGQELGESYDALLEACATRQRRIADDALYVATLIREINEINDPPHVMMQCNNLINRRIGQVPWSRCVQATCAFDRTMADAMIGQAPAELRQQLRQSCPAKK